MFADNHKKGVRGCINNSEYKDMKDSYNAKNDKCKKGVTYRGDDGAGKRSTQRIFWSKLLEVA